jgi:hypothetical protein
MLSNIANPLPEPANCTEAMVAVAVGFTQRFWPNALGSDVVFPIDTPLESKASKKPVAPGSPAVSDWKPVA